jgi:hypothetical protein
MIDDREFSIEEACAEIREEREYRRAKEESVYSLRLCCGNCFSKWLKEFPKGFAANVHAFGSERYIRDANSERVQCPACGCDNHVGKVIPE